MSKRLARPVFEMGSAVRDAAGELLDLAAQMSLEETGGLDAAQLRELFALYAARVELAAGKVLRRVDMMRDQVPQLAKLRRRELFDASIRSAVSQLTHGERRAVTVGEVERWLDTHAPDSVRDPATIRAALVRIGRLKRNPRGRPRKATKKK